MKASVLTLSCWLLFESFLTFIIVNICFWTKQRLSQLVFYMYVYLQNYYLFIIIFMGFKGRKCNMYSFCLIYIQHNLRIHHDLRWMCQCLLPVRPFYGYTFFLYTKHDNKTLHMSICTNSSFQANWIIWVIEVCRV